MSSYNDEDRHVNFVRDPLRSYVDEFQNNKIHFHLSEMTRYHMSLVTRKPVFGVCDQVRLKPACSATETS